ncbi:MAG: penicillin-binding protein activator [Deltaproteobacteria bacterium]|nr:penicillin-binding protein activator [Deltaproteobacteria bacterium]MBI3295498.1 penicillin-binding protein activator [Deltaproteobacteria bacterium]
MRLRRLAILAWAFSVLLSFTHCAHKESKDSAENLTPANEAAQLFQKAEAAFKVRESERALNLFRKVKAKYPGTRIARLSLYRLASAAYHKRDYPLAAQLFQEMLKPAADGTVTGVDEFRVDATYNWAASEFQQKHYERAYEVLASIDLNSPANRDTKRLEMVYALVERTAKKLGDAPGLLAATAAHAQLPLTQAQIQPLEKEIDGLLSAIHEVALLSGILTADTGGRVRPVAVVQDPVVRAKIQDRIRSLSGESSSAPEVVVESSPSPDVVAEAPRVIRVGSGNVGVLLPLSGKFALVGRRALDAILLSAAVFDSRSTSKLKLFIEDTGSNEVEAERAVARLANQQNVSAIIGPVSAREATVVAKKAQELGVVNLSLTSREGVTEAGGLVFQNALIPRVQIESLAEYCIQEKGFKRFAILAPSDPFGTDMAMQFWDAIEKRGGIVSAMETYAPEDNDYQVQIQKMVGLYDSPKLRKTELDKIADYQKEMKQKNPRAKEKRIRLQAIVDFDAIFIPDIPKVVSQVVPNLAYFDVTGATLLGTAEWGTNQLYRRIGKGIVGALFPVAIQPETHRPVQFAFINLYKDAMGFFPDLLATQAYEAMEIVGVGLNKAGGSSSSALASAIAGAGTTESPLGAFSFDQKRIATRKLPVFSIDSSGSLIEMSKAID